jgi:hypothetical protein
MSWSKETRGTGRLTESIEERFKFFLVECKKKRAVVLGIKKSKKKEPKLYFCLVYLFCFLILFAIKPHHDLTQGR